jgi:hypothetical protein
VLVAGSRHEVMSLRKSLWERDKRYGGDGNLILDTRDGQVRFPNHIANAPFSSITTPKKFVSTRI